VADLPAAWASAPGWSLVPVAGEVTGRWASIVPAGASLCVGWQGMLRTLHAGERVTRRGPERSAILARADLVGVSRNDLDGGLSDEELLAFLTPGASLLMTDGEAGGRLLGTAADGRSNPPIAYGSVPAVAHDPTGAGDSFLAAYFATTLRPDLVPGSSEAPAAGLRFAAAVAAGVVEGAGATTVPTLEEVRARLDAS
jgi:sugar/nucleoside kinase (ribokinase family)